MKVIVSQYGSRRRYMIPQLLHDRNCLKYLYTDSTSQSILGRIAKILSLIIGNRPALTRLCNRVTGIPSSKVKNNDRLQIRQVVNHILKRSVLSDVENIFEGSSSIYKRWGVADADWLYTMFIENFEFTKYAKEQGVKVLTDIYENPYIWTELEKEIEKEAYSPIKHLKELYHAQAVVRSLYIDDLLATADQYLVPSEYVRDSLKASPCYDESKVNIIPYVSSVKNKTYNNNPIPGRIIWIGNDVVRKGLCYCAEAASKLKDRYPGLDFRIIGPIPNELKTSDYYKDLNFIGYCNKAQLEEEFQKADIFVFPTLAEGFAAVLLEASSFGVPIITTKASGFSYNAPCVFIERHSSEAIIKSVSDFLENREIRNSYSRRIFDYSQSLGESQFGDKLVELLETK